MSYTGRSYATAARLVAPHERSEEHARAFKGSLYPCVGASASRYHLPTSLGEESLSVPSDESFDSSVSYAMAKWGAMLSCMVRIVMKALEPLKWGFRRQGKNLGVRQNTWNGGIRVSNLPAHT